MKTIIISSEREKRYALSLIEQMEVDGSDTVILKKTDDSSTARQRQLQWLWYTETAASGIGSADTKEAVHINSKWVFARPILLRDDEVFGIIYEKFMETVKDSINYSQYCKVFANEYISTERMTRQQRAEFLRDFQNYWTRKGVNLTDPSMHGLDGNLGFKPKQED